ncbi:MAG: HD domain-containing phosphohydrolase [Paenibacillaceae bacterium]
MRYVHIESVESGQFLGRTIFASNGAILLSDGVQLTVYMINTLRRIGVTMIYIQEVYLEDVEIIDVVSEENKRLIMKLLGETFDSLRSGKEFSTKNISVSVDRMLDDVMKNKEVLVQLSDIRTKDNEMYVHAINVCTISALIGINMSLNQVQMKELAIGALLHDVGKIELITDDNSADLKKHHTWRGFELLKNKREFSLLIAHVAFQHHETLDGEGIPRKLDAEQIHIYAKIVSVANIFDNLLYNPVDGTRMLPHDACEQMMTLAGTKIDQEVLIHFLRTVSIYPTGSSVRLSTKETGVVVGQHRGLPGRPIVRVVKQEFDNELQIKEIDLAKHTTVFIDTVLS